MQPLDLLLINPGGRSRIYQDLGRELTAVEPPLWCRLIAGYVLDRGHSVAILDTEAEEMEPAAVVRQVRQQAPRLVAMVVYGHQPSASTQQMAPAGELCRAIKDAAPHVPIVIAGGHVAALPDRTVAEEAVDFACNGEGPVTVERLLAALRADGTPDLAAVPGLVWREGGRIRTNAPAPLIADLDADLHGDVWHLLPMERYRAHNWQCFDDLSRRQPYASVYTSLGCPFRCNFCCINAPFATNRYRMRDPARVVDEVDRLYRTYGVRTFKIVDEMFVLNDRHVRAICDGLAALPYAAELNLWAYARVDTVKPATLALLRRAGIRWLALGIESGSAHVRDGAEKSFGEDDIRTVVRSIRAAGIHVIGNFIFGLPDDTLETMRQTLDLAKDLECEFANFYSAMAYPGSALYAEAQAKGWPLPETWSGYSQHSYDCTPLPTATLGSSDVLRFRDCAFREYFENPRYLMNIEKKFGSIVRRHVEDMTRHSLRRCLLERDGIAA